MKEEIKCPVCGNVFTGNQFDDCPVCDWEYSGLEDTDKPDETDEVNKISIKQAKENFAKGLNIWGEPLPNRKFSTFKKK